MSRNEGFHWDFAKLSHSKEAQKALDAFLMAPPGDIKAIRKAIIDHKSVWEPVLVSKKADDFQDTDQFLNNQIHITTLRNNAATYRVKLGLKHADKDVLVSIMNHNEDACRDYIASRSELGGLQKIPDWSINSITVLNTHDIDELKVQAKAYYQVYRLQRFISSKETDNNQLLPLLQSEDPEVWKKQLQEIINEDEHANVASAVELTHLDQYKLAIVNKQINSTIDTPKLKAISEAKDINAMKNALKSLGIVHVEWLKSPEFQQIRHNAQQRRTQVAQDERIKQFDSELKKRSPFDISVHSELRALFKELPSEKQAELLKKPECLGVIAFTEDKQTLEFYLGKDAQRLDALVEENSRMVTYRDIQNSEVAKILVQIEPKKALTVDEQRAINNLLRNAPIPRDEAQYIQLVNVIENQYNPANTAAFYKAFGLTDNGKAFSHGGNHFKEVREQIEYNEEISDKVQKDSSYQTSLMGYFLTLKKDKVIYPDDVIDAFKNASDVDDFIKKLKPQVGDHIAATLKSQLTPALFKKFKDDALKYQLEHIEDVRSFGQGLGAVEQSLATIYKAIEQAVDGQKDRFKHLLNIDLDKMYKSSLTASDVQRSQEMRKHYQTLRDDNLLILDELKRQHHELNRLLQGMDAVKSSTAKQIPRYIQLREKLVKELDAVESHLAFHNRIEERFADKAKGILKIQNEAIQHQTGYVLSAKGVSRTFAKREDIKPVASASSAPKPPNTVVDASSGGRNPQFILSQRISSKGELVVVDIEFEKGNVSTGRYTIDYHVPAEVRVKGNEVTKMPGGKYEVLSFPQLPPLQPPAEYSEQEKDALRQGRIELAMYVAANVIADAAGPPTKKKPWIITSASAEEMEYLFTALVVLGADTPKMKFGPDAIKLDKWDKNQFDYERRTMPVLDISLGMQESDLYKDMEQQKSHIIKALKTVTQEKLGYSSEDKEKIDKKTKESADLTKMDEKQKDKTSLFRERVKKTMQSMGPAPQPKSKPQNRP